VSKPSPKFEEYTGDLALAQSDPAGAVEAWTKALSAEPKALRLLEKVAQAQRNQKHWTEEDAAWTAYINVQIGFVSQVRSNGLVDKLSFLLTINDVYSYSNLLLNLFDQFLAVHRNHAISGFQTGSRGGGTEQARMTSPTQHSEPARRPEDRHPRRS
jgi:hypothetical protein